MSMETYLASTKARRLKIYTLLCVSLGFDIWPPLNNEQVIVGSATRASTNQLAQKRTPREEVAEERTIPALRLLMPRSR